MNLLIKDVFAESGIIPAIDGCKGVEVVRRKGRTGDIYFFINHGVGDVSIDIEKEGLSDVFSPEVVLRTLELKKNGVAVLKNRKG